MRIVADSGLWSTGPLVAPGPLVALLEVSGAVLSWPVDDPSESARIAFTDQTRADWLWRVLGESGHVGLVTALAQRVPGEQSIELAGIDLLPGSVDPLRRLAIGHWLRRWWPASHRDGIVGLDPAILDAEIAMLTAAAQDFFTDDTFDSDVAELLQPHGAALTVHAATGDPRVVELVRACTELADEVGVGGWSAVPVPVAASRRDDYALAAAADVSRLAPGAIASGVASINWAGVAPGTFDAAENTVDWSVEVAGSTANIVVWAALSRPGAATEVAVNVRSGSVRAAGGLDADGHATLPLVDAEGQPLTESAAWNHDWSTTSVAIGADAEESPQTRDRIRAFARSRLEHPARDAFLAEILAAESDY